jgi:hypothetical protein
MSRERCDCQSCGGAEEVICHIMHSKIIAHEDRAHPYEEPAYEVYKMEDV